MKFYDGFIGHEYAGQKLYFVPGDDQKTYEKNSKQMPDDWYYKNRTISYQYNNLGHRCKNIIDIDLHNYILFVGCSHTEGIGLELEQTYPYLISQQLKVNYYNLGLSSSGLDIFFYNLSSWLIRNPYPICIILQWPDEYRFVVQNDTVEYLVPHGSWDKQDEIKDFILAGDSLEYFQTRKKYITEYIKHLPIPTVNLSCGRKLNIPNALNFSALDHARDLKHYGINTHINISSQILEQINARTGS